MKKIELTRLSEIRWDREHQARAGMNEDVIADYAEAMGRERERIEAGELVWPPLEVVQDAVSMEMWGWDGHHRSQAAARAGLELFPAIRTVAEDAKAMAQWLACGANQAHGLRRSNEDKRRAVEMALGMHPEMSDRSLAAHCGVSAPTVAVVRRDVCKSFTHEQAETRTRSDGRTFTVAPKAAPAETCFDAYGQPVAVGEIVRYSPPDVNNIPPRDATLRARIDEITDSMVTLRVWNPEFGSIEEYGRTVLCSKDCIAKLESAPAARPDTLAALRQYELDVTAAFNLGCSQGRALVKMEPPENHDQCNAYTDGYKQGQASAEDDCAQAHKDGYAEGVAGRPDLCPFADSISPKAAALAKHWREGFEAGQQYRAKMAATGLAGNDGDDDEAQEQPETTHEAAAPPPPPPPPLSAPPVRPVPARPAAHAASGDVPPPPMLVKCECEHAGESHHGEGGRCMLPWCQCQGFEAHPDSEEPDWDGGMDYDSLLEVFDRLAEPLGKAQWMRALMALQTLVERVFLADAPMGWIQTRDDIHAAKNAIGDAVRMANRMDGHLEAHCAKLRPKR